MTDSTGGDHHAAGLPMKKDVSLDQLHLLVTDLDGTLLGPKPEFSHYNAFRDLVASLRQTPGFNWVICTGRSLRSFKRIFLPLRSFGIAPDYIITSHAYIFQHKAWGYVPHLVWNLHIRMLQFRHMFYMRMALPRMRKVLAKHVPFARIASCNRYHIGFRFEDDETTAKARDILTDVARPYQFLQVFRYRNEVVVHVVPFTKGVSLQELAREIMVEPANILAIGDGHNDISMMTPTIARHCACPANAVPEIIEHVYAHGGHVAQTGCLEGVIEIIQGYTSGNVRNELPSGWVPADELARPPNTLRHHSHKRSRWWQSLLIFTAVIYTVLLVFASFKLIPFAGPIRKPYLLLIRLINEIIGWFR